MYRNRSSAHGCLGCEGTELTARELEMALQSAKFAGAWVAAGSTFPSSPKLPAHSPRAWRILCSWLRLVVLAGRERERKIGGKLDLSLGGKPFRTGNYWWSKGWLWEFLSLSIFAADCKEPPQHILHQATHTARGAGSERGSI